MDSEETENVLIIIPRQQPPVTGQSWLGVIVAAVVIVLLLLVAGYIVFNNRQAVPITPVTPTGTIGPPGPAGPAGTTMGPPGKMGVNGARGETGPPASFTNSYVSFNIPVRDRLTIPYLGTIPIVINRQSPSFNNYYSYTASSVTLRGTGVYKASFLVAGLSRLDSGIVTLDALVGLELSSGTTRQTLISASGLYSFSPTDPLVYTSLGDLSANVSFEATAGSTLSLINQSRDSLVIISRTGSGGYLTVTSLFDI